MKHIPATDAKVHLAELLRAVERGESFSITRHGKAIAHLVPAAAAEDQARRDAVARFRERRRSWGRAAFGPDEIAAARHEGHRA